MVGTFSLASGCGSTEAPSSELDDASGFCPPDGVDPFAPIGPATAVPLSESTLASSGCAAVERAFALEPSPHVEDCSAVEYTSNPPSSGPHYSHWASYRAYDDALPRGFWVHSLEHGAIVFAYSCSDCEDEIESARAFIDTLPVDPACASAGVGRRVILTPDPLLTTRWAAAGWGFTLSADCFEPSVFRAFFDAHYAAAPEDICGGGAFADQ